MKVNKDLADAVMMVSFIILVLVGTTSFDEESLKTILMGMFGVTTVITGVLRFWGGSRQKEA